MGAWIEIEQEIEEIKKEQESRPSWARGLKLGSFSSHLANYLVAPLMGAWIEIVKMFDGIFAISMSRPSWARGLKYQY